MIVLQYIKEALFEHSCVIVPDFGGFLSEEISANINPINNLFQSPNTELAFNPSLIKDDGLLRSEISIGEGITLQESSEQIKRFVDVINEQLKQEKTVVLDGLGVFSRIDNNLIYNPEEIHNFNIEGFGLSEFKLEPIDRNTEEMKQVRPVQPARRVVKRTPVATPVKADDVKTSSPKAENKKSIFLLLPLFMLLTVAGFIGYKISVGDDQTSQLAHNESGIQSDKAGLLSAIDNSSVDLTEDIDSYDEEINIAAGAVPEDKEVVEEESIERDAIVEEEVFLEEAIEESVEETIEDVYTESNNTTIEITTSPMYKYHIIGGVFSSLDNAKKFSSEIQGARIFQAATFYKVSIATYDNESEANIALPNLKSEFGSDLWVTKY